MLNQEQQARLDELHAMAKKGGKEKAEIKALERLLKQSDKTEKPPAQRSVFATQATTKINPLPVRFTQRDRARLTNLANDIKIDNAELVLDELGSEREINDTKLLRAAVLLLSETPHDKIIDAIKRVKKDMLK